MSHSLLFLPEDLLNAMMVYAYSHRWECEDVLDVYEVFDHLSACRFSEYSVYSEVPRLTSHGYIPRLNRYQVLLLMLFHSSYLVIFTQSLTVHHLVHGVSKLS